MKTLNLADIKTYALMNGLSMNEAKKLLSEQIKGTNDDFFKKRIKKNNFTDNFISSSNISSTDIKEKNKFYENFFINNKKEEQTLNEIETLAKNPEINGKSSSEIVRYFADKLEIFEEDAATIFTKSFIDEVLEIKTIKESRSDEKHR